jgi:hypothetical protein
MDKFQKSSDSKYRQLNFSISSSLQSISKTNIDVQLIAK